MMKNSAGCRHDFRVKMWGTSSPDDKLTADLGNVIETHRSAVVGRIVLRRENYHRAILDFYNNLGTKRTSQHVRALSAFGGKAALESSRRIAGIV